MTKFNKVTPETKTDEDVNNLSEILTEQANSIMTTNQGSFALVIGMNIVGFGLGIFLIIYSMGLINSGQHIETASILGVAGMADVAFLVYKPIREIQRSRANATNILSAFGEYKFISLWSGKSYSILHEKIKNNQGISEEQLRLIEGMSTLLRLKAKTTAEIIAAVNTNVGNSVFTRDADKYLEKIDRQRNSIEKLKKAYDELYAGLEEKGIKLPPKVEI